MNLESILAMTPTELIILNELVPLAKEAKEVAQLIRKTYRCFGIEEKSIVVWRDSSNREFLTHDGVWQARYLHQSYDVLCTEQEIFKHFQAEYLISNGFAARESETGRLNEACGYFRSFVERTRQKLKEQADSDAD